MRVLVTGGAGFIGSHLSDAFHASGDKVFVVDDLSHGRADRLFKGASLYVESVLDSPRFNALVAEINPELICHLAAQVDVRVSVAAPSHDADVNVVGTVNVLEAARAVRARVLFSSTGGAIYGADAPIPSPETTPAMPGSPYGVAKYCAEQYISLYNRLYGTTHSVLRFANVYGPRQGSEGEGGVISIFCANSIQGKPLNIYGDGKQTRDFVYVRDCAQAFLAAANCDKAGIWNIGSGTEISVLELARLTARLTGDRSQIVFSPARIGELYRSAVSWELAAADLGWQPSTALADGVETVVRWFESLATDGTSQ